MKDMLDIIYAELLKNDVVNQLVADHIFYFEAPETEKTTDTKLIITPLRPPHEEVGGSDIGLTTNFIYQVDVQSQKRKTCKEIQAAVKQVMTAFRFAQLTDGLDEYLSDQKVYVDARRYEGNTDIYDTNY